MPDMGLFETIFSVRSMRRLRPDPIPDAVIRQIIEAGVHAPSGSNFQNWGFVVVDGSDEKRFIRDHYLKHYRELERQGTIPNMSQIPIERRRMFDSAIYLAEHMHEAPIILLACTGTDFPTYAQLDNPRSITATLHASTGTRMDAYSSRCCHEIKSASISVRSTAIPVKRAQS